MNKAVIATHPVNTARTYKVINPGEEAMINNKADIVVRKNVDTESAVAWMKGFFGFSQCQYKNSDETGEPLVQCRCSIYQSDTRANV